MVAVPAAQREGNSTNFHSPVSWEVLNRFLSPRTGLGDPAGTSGGRGDASWAVRSYFKLWQRKKDIQIASYQVLVRSKLFQAHLIHLLLLL